MSDNLKRKILTVFLVLLALFLAFSIVAMIFVSSNMKKEFGRAERSEFDTGLIYADYAPGYPRSEISFYSGDNLLRGYVYGEENSGGLVVISHGIGGGGEGYLPEILRFVNSGYQVLSFDNTGSWSSDGDGTTGLTQSYLDLDAALDFVESEERFKDLQIYLYGHSWGGYAVAAVLREDHNITAAVSVAGYENPLDMIFEWTTGSMNYVIANAAKPYIAVYNFFKFGTVSNLHAVDAINSTDTPILIIHGANDELIGFNTASIISHRNEITNPNAEFWVRNGAGQSGHNSLFMSQGSVTYRLKLNEEYDALRAQYGGEVPDDVRREFFNNIDRDRYNRLDDEFMTKVVDFFRKSEQDDFMKQLLG